MVMVKVKAKNVFHKHKRKIIRYIILDIISIVLFIYMMILAAPISEDNSHTLQGIISDAWVTNIRSRFNTTTNRLFLEMNGKSFVLQTKSISQEELDETRKALLFGEDSVTLVIPNYQPVPFMIAGWTDVAAISSDAKVFYSIDLHNKEAKQESAGITLAFCIIWGALLFIQVAEWMIWFYKPSYRKKRKKQ